MSAIMCGVLLFLLLRVSTLKLSLAGKISFAALCLTGLSFVVCLWGWSLTWRHLGDRKPLQLILASMPTDAARRRAWFWGRAVIAATALLVLLVISTALFASSGPMV